METRKFSAKWGNSERNINNCTREKKGKGPTCADVAHAELAKKDTRVVKSIYGKQLFGRGLSGLPYPLYTNKRLLTPRIRDNAPGGHIAIAKQITHNNENCDKKLKMAQNH